MASGTLSKDGVSVAPGVSVLSPGESWVWHLTGDANGLLDAFSVVTWDGGLASSPPVQV